MIIYRDLDDSMEPQDGVAKRGGEGLKLHGAWRPLRGLG